MNYYDILGVDSDADDKTIRTAFRTLARRYHPDAGAGASSERFRKVVEAYETLNNRKRRNLYDRLSPGQEKSVRPPAEPITSPEFAWRRSGIHTVTEPERFEHAVFFGDRVTSALQVERLLGELMRSIEDEFFSGSDFSRW